LVNGKPALLGNNNNRGIPLLFGHKNWPHGAAI
jgi:hypothetical protein